jgi:hypothetical protein
MKKLQLDSSFARLALRVFVCTLVMVAGSAATLAATIDIQFTGANLVYDGTNLHDAGGSAGGVADPADADGLTSAVFSVDGTPVGTLLTDISLDVFIPDVTGIPVGAGVVDVQTTPGNPGFFDLLVGTSPLASEFLLVDLEDVSITYIDVLGIVQFTFGAAVSDTFAQNLPFGLAIGDPVSVSFSAQIIAGTKTDNGSVITGFEAAGAGEFRGPAVPEPTAICMAVVGGLACFGLRRNR